jgi:hypothetical protein
VEISPQPLQIIDVSEPSEPLRVGTMELGRIHAMAPIEGTTRALVAGLKGVNQPAGVPVAAETLLLELGNPSAPEVLARAVISPPAAEQEGFAIVDVAAVGERGVVLERWFDGEGSSFHPRARLRVLDASRYGGLRQLAVVELAPLRSLPWDMAVDESRVLLATSKGLEVFSWTPFGPAQAVATRDGYPARHIEAADGTAYLGYWIEDLWVYVDTLDVRDPHRPEVVSTVEVTEGPAFAGTPAGLVLEGGRLFAGVTGAGVRMYSVGGPLAPQWQADLMARAVGVAAGGCYVYVATDTSGLVVAAVRNQAATRVEDPPSGAGAWIQQLYLPRVAVGTGHC